jgi:hypothetical protein
MDKHAAVFLREGAQRSPGRLLFIHKHARASVGRFEAKREVCL